MEKAPVSPLFDISRYPIADMSQDTYSSASTQPPFLFRTYHSINVLDSLSIRLIEALTDPKTWLFFLFAVVSNLQNGISIQYAIIIQSFGFKTWQTTLLSIPSGAAVRQLYISIRFQSRLTSGFSSLANNTANHQRQHRGLPFTPIPKLALAHQHRGLCPIAHCCHPPHHPTVQ